MRAHRRIRFPLVNEPKESGVSPVPRQPPQSKTLARARMLPDR